MSALHEKELPWRDYLANHTGHPQAAEYLTRTENFLSFISTLYKLEGEIPPIFIFSSGDLNAFASENEKIFLSSGLFSAIEADLLHTVEGLDTQAAKKTLFAQTLTIIVWIVAHEFFHITRAHFLVLQAHQSSVRKALEFDADLMGVAGTYRWLDHIMRKMDPNAPVKTLLLSAIFWVMRAQIGTNAFRSEGINEEYPTWHLRIFNVVRKLAQFGNCDPFGVVNENYAAEFQKLLEFSVSLDIEYCHIHSLSESTFGSFILENAAALENPPIEERWEVVKETVRLHQRLQDLRKPPVVH